MRIRKMILLISSIIVLSCALIFSSSADYTEWSKTVSDAMFPPTNNYVYNMNWSSSSGHYSWNEALQAGLLYGTADAISSHGLAFKVPINMNSNDILSFQLKVLSTNNFNNDPYISVLMGSTRTSINVTRTRDGEQTVGSRTYYKWIIDVPKNNLPQGTIDAIFVYWTTGYGTMYLGIYGINVISSTGINISILNAINSANQKFDDINTKLQGIDTDLGAIITNQGTLSTATSDIIAALDSLEENQNLMLYKSSADGVILNQLNSKMDSIKGRIDELTEILEDYPTEVDVDEVTQTISNATTTYKNYFNSTDYKNYTDNGSVFTSFFDNSFISTIIIVILGMVLLSYILFGKKA